MGRMRRVGQLARSRNLGVELYNRRHQTRRLYRRPVPELGNWSVRRINGLHAALPGLAHYLEIGLFAGTTFEHVTIPQRVGVDPSPRFDVARLPPSASVFVMTSDDYFATCSEQFDIVFADGLHTYQQTYRDTVSALKACPMGAVLVDDVVPCDEVSAIPDQDASLATRRRRGMPGSPWHGDVFKMVVCLNEHHPELTYRTIVDGGNPQLLVWREEGTDVQPVSDAQLSTYGSLTYADVFARGIPDAFRPCSESAVLVEASASLRSTYG